MANKTVYPYGTGGQMPATIPIADDLVTNSAQVALSARQGKVLRDRILLSDVVFWQNSSSADWITGNIYGGHIETTYSNRYIIITGFPAGVTEITITRGTPPDSTYYLGVLGSSDGVNFTNLTGFNTAGGTNTYTLGNYDRIAFLMWDKPSTARAQQEIITITYPAESEVINEADVVDSLTSQATNLPLSAKQGNVLDGKIVEIIGGGEYELTWVTGDITNTGALNPSYANKSTNFINLVASKFIVHNPTNKNVKICCYDASKSYLGGASGVSPNTTIEITPLTNTKYIRLCAWDKPSDEVVANITMTYVYDGSLMKLQEEINAIEGNSVYDNPVLSIDAPDPCVVDGQDGFFYMLGTGMLASRTIYRSPNLIDWEEADRPFTDKAITDCYADLNISSMNFWAPEIVKIGGKYNLYTSKQANPMVVFQSNHPFFGYEYIGKIITATNGLSNDNIDACVRYDLDGTLWMFWGSTSGIYRQKLTADGLTLDANDTKVHVAGKLLSQDSSRATVFEGAYLYRKNGYWYLFVSAGSYSNYTYCLKVGRSTTLNGTFVDKEGNDMADGYATTILSSANGDTLYGPGHNGQIFTDRNTRTYMVYHSHYTGAPSTSYRYICLQEIFWDADGWPYFVNNKPQVGGNIKPVL